MLNEDKIILANKNFLDFFNIKNLQTFHKEGFDFGNQLLEHSSFLFNTTETSWFDKVKDNPGKLFHIKIKDSKDKMCHLILKMQAIADKKDYYILSMDDISELALLNLFDKKVV